ncbi:hypothetical protein [Aquimarina algiphila]|uniref:Bacteriophage tail tape measure N-terminal domain-containing protein n=1 Tax=Aquimarina algiphila TaxID=2047982 RepID=A0A554VE54_9FLAO|nr:hypothetical protein [Aquimarina algiphila]TSE05250.1 hypothetical protein FOF46_23590 [Aquimarina algiphila]
MAKKINLVDFEIEGIDKIISDTGDLISEQNRLKKSNADLKKNTEGLTNATDAQRQRYVQNQIEIKRLSSEIRTNNKIVEAQTSAQKLLGDALNRNVDTEAKARASNAELISIRKTLNRNTEEGREQIDKINKKLDENNKIIKENVSEYEQQKIGIGDYTSAIKDAFGQTAGFNKILGTLQQTFKTLAPLGQAIKSDFNSLAASYRQGAAEARALSGTQRLVAQSTNIVNTALKAFKIALISTGIGAILVAVGALIAFLTSTQEGIDKVNSVLIPLRVIFESLVGLLQKVGKALFEAFSNPKEVLTDLLDFIKNQVINRFQGLAKIVKGALTFDLSSIKEGIAQTEKANKVIIDGIKGAADAVSNTVKDAISRGKQIAELTKQIENAEVRIIGVRANLNDQLKQQEQIAKDITLSTTERLEATEEARRLAKAIQDEENKILELKIQQLELEQKSNDTSREEQKELEELRAQLVRNQTQERQTELRFLGARNAILKEQEAARQKAIDKAIKQNQNELKLFIATEGKRAESLQERLKVAEKIAEDELAISRRKLETGRLSQIEFELEVLRIKEEFLERQTEATIENLEQELELFEAQNQSRIEQGERLTDALVEQEIERLNAIYEAEQEILKEQREADLISELEFLTAKQELKNNFDAEQEEIKSDLENQKIEERLAKEALEFEERILSLEERNATEFELQQANLERQQELELAKANKEIQNQELLEKAKSNIERKYALKNAEIEGALSKAKIDARLQVLSAVGQIFGKESAIGKATAIAETTITTFQSATNAFNSLAGIPVVGPTLGAVAAGAAVASGLANVAKIVGINIGGADVAGGLSSLSSGVQAVGATIPKGEQGGLLKGARHSQGGILIEAEDGEMIMKREAVSMFLPQLQQMQIAAGGNPGLLGQPFARNGGITSRSLTRESNNLQSTQQLIEDNIQNIKVTNVAEDTIGVFNDGIEVQNQADL